MDNHHPPPIFRSGSWCQTDLLANGNLVQVSTGQRIRWWKQTLSAFTRYSGTRWRSTEARPHSSALQVKLACYPLLFSDAVHQRVEAFLAKHIPEGVVSQNSRAWVQCPVPTRNWDVSCHGRATSALGAEGRQLRQRVTKGLGLRVLNPLDVLKVPSPSWPPKHTTKPLKKWVREKAKALTLK